MVKTRGGEPQPPLVVYMTIRSLSGSMFWSYLRSGPARPLGQLFCERVWRAIGEGFGKALDMCAGCGCRIGFIGSLGPTFRSRSPTARAAGPGPDFDMDAGNPNPDDVRLV